MKKSENHLKIKLKHLEKRAQIIVFSIEGELLVSCDTLVDISKEKGNIFHKSLFLESIKDQLLNTKSNQILKFFCISDNLFEKHQYCDHRLEVSTEEGQKIVHWLIEDHTDQYVHVRSIQQERNDSMTENMALYSEQHNIEKENAGLKLMNQNIRLKANQLILTKLKHDFKIPIKGLNHLLKATASGSNEQTKLLIINYLENAIDQLLASKNQERRMPFKLDHVLSAVLDIFSELSDTQIVVEREFESSIIMANKYKFFINIVQVISLILEQKPDGSIKVRCSYDKSKKLIAFKFRTNLFSNSIQKVTNIFAEINEYTEIIVDKSSVILSCPVSEIKLLSNTPVSVETNKAISKTSFPYLYGISNQDLDMVKDLVEGIIDVVPVELEKMKKLNSEKNYDALARTAHKVKPNFESLDQKQFSKVINDIELAALEQDDKYLDQHLPEFIESSNAKIEEIRSNYL